MKRKCFKLSINSIVDLYPSLVDSNTLIYIDKENSEKIIKTIEDRKDKFRLILFTILSGKYNNDLYGKENISKKAKNITAMKFKKGNNERIYCKEFRQNGKKIVMIINVKKKSQKITKSIISLIESISKYEYEFD